LATIQLQAQDSLRSVLFRPNVIKLNLSANVLYSPAFLVAYERALTSNKSFSVEAGYVTFPKILPNLGDSIGFLEKISAGGFKIDADFRFYLKKENCHQAPHGFYIAPYIAYYHFKNVSGFTPQDTAFATGQLDFTFTLKSPQIGGELGYQFSLWKDKLTIDLLLLGPSIAYYHAKLGLSGNFDINEESEYLNDLLDHLSENFPVFGDLVENKEVSTSGIADLFYGGFRYSVSAGFRF
jgi:hypothetical protein